MAPARRSRRPASSRSRSERRTTGRRRPCAGPPRSRRDARDRGSSGPTSRRSRCSAGRQRPRCAGRCARRDEDGLAANAAKGAHRRIDTARDVLQASSNSVTRITPLESPPVYQVTRIAPGALCHASARAATMRRNRVQPDPPIHRCSSCSAAASVAARVCGCRRWSQRALGAGVSVGHVVRQRGRLPAGGCARRAAWHRPGVCTMRSRCGCFSSPACSAGSRRSRPSRSKR